MLSDTHDHIPNTRKAIDFFRVQGVSTLIHAGDLCSPFMVPEFEGFKLHTVFGNNDGDHFRILQKAADIGAAHHGEFARLSFGGRRMGVYHGTQPDITEALVRCGLYDVIISGHTHEAFSKSEGPTLWLNPGSVHGFGKTSTAAVYDTETGKARITEL
ncbi:MAG: metallophosphoesterase [Cyclonatronaceae bacterium]